MKYILGKKGKNLLLSLFFLLIFAIGTSIYFRNTIVDNFVGSSGNTKVSDSGITNIQDVFNIPGVGKNTIPSNVTGNWSMVNEIVEPDGTIIQDIVNTDGTVLTITNKQNIINTGVTSAPTRSGGGSGGGGGSNTGGSDFSTSTYNRNLF
jgi:hypothetical protein